MQEFFIKKNKEFNHIGSSGIGGINLRNELDALLNEFGFSVLLRRSNKNLRCSCWSHITDSADKDCLYCMGSGYVSAVEKHITMQKRGKASLDMTNASIIIDDHISFYFRYKVHPVVNDTIYLVGWSGDHPTNVISSYEIDRAEAFRGDYGRIEFYKCTCINEPVNINDITVSIRRNASNIDDTPSNIPIQYDLLFNRR